MQLTTPTVNLTFEQHCEALILSVNENDLSSQRQNMF